MTSVEFFRKLICTNNEETKRFDEFVEHVSRYGLEYEVFDLAMESIKMNDNFKSMSRDEIENHLSEQAYEWDL